MVKKFFRFLFFVGLIATAVIGFIYYQNFVSPIVSTNGKDVAIYIRPGENVDAVASSLVRAGALNDEVAFKRLAELKNYRGRNIVAGKYMIKDGFTNNQLINHLRAGNGKEAVKVTINLERDLKQISGTLAENLMLDSLTIYRWLTDQKKLSTVGYSSETVISMFIPNTYFLDWDISADQLMNRMKKENDKFWNSERTNKLKRTGLSKTEVSTLASIVYWETKIPEDMRTVAGVYMNRLDVGMPLQADPTLIFALGDYSVKRVLNKDKELDSPYNTYKYTGLPPGPILIPPVNCIDAVLDFGHHDFYYFVAKEDLSGETYFSRTHEEHINYARRYQNALNKRKVYR